MAESRRKPTRRKKPPKRLYINVGLDEETHAIVSEAAQDEMRNLNQQTSLWVTEKAREYKANRQAFEAHLAALAENAPPADDPSWVEVDLDELDGSVSPDEGSSET